MNRGFYELLGIDPGASAGQLRVAYTTEVTRLSRRRRQLVEQGGDPNGVDVERARLDEAWRVLSDPQRRRAYDALRAWSASARRPMEAEEFWKVNAPRLAPPAAAVAVKLLRALTRLDRLEELPLAPSSSEGEPPTLIPSDDDRTSPSVPSGVRRLEPERPAVELTRTEPRRDPRPEPRPAAAPPPAVEARVAPLRPVPTQAPPPAPAPEPRPSPAREGPPLVVVDGKSPSVLVIPPDARRRSLTDQEIAGLVQQHGYSGALLLAAREARAMSRAEVAEITKISLRYLEAIEQDAYDRLPSATFVRGYVRELARLYRLEEEVVVAGYLRRLSG